MALNGALMVILGGAFWLLPDFFTLAMFPHVLENEAAIDVGNALRKNMGAGFAFLSGLFYFPVKTVQNIPLKDYCFLLRSVSSSCLITLVHAGFSGQASVPTFMLVFFWQFVVVVASGRLSTLSSEIFTLFFFKQTSSLIVFWYQQPRRTQDKNWSVSLANLSNNDSASSTLLIYFMP